MATERMRALEWVLNEMERHTFQGNDEACKICGHNWRDTTRHLIVGEHGDVRLRIRSALAEAAAADVSP